MWVVYFHDAATSRWSPCVHYACLNIAHRRYYVWKLSGSQLPILYWQHLNGPNGTCHYALDRLGQLGSGLYFLLRSWHSAKDVNLKLNLLAAYSHNTIIVTEGRAKFTVLRGVRTQLMMMLW